MTDDREEQTNGTEDAGRVDAVAQSDPLEQDAADVADAIERSPVTDVPSAGPPASAELDRHGEPYDPAIHQRSINKRTGHWKRKRGAGSGEQAPRAAASRPATYTSTVHGSGAAPQPGPNPPETDGDTRAAAEAIAATVPIPFASLLGGEWLADAAEIKLAADAWERYLRSRGVTEVPPEMLLVVAYAGYIGKRIAKPETRGKVANTWAKVRLWWRARREPRLYKGGTASAHADSRANGSGEEFAAQEPGSAVPPQRDSSSRVHHFSR